MTKVRESSGTYHLQNKFQCQHTHDKCEYLYDVRTVNIYSALVNTWIQVTADRRHNATDNINNLH